MAKRAVPVTVSEGRGPAILENRAVAFTEASGDTVALLVCNPERLDDLPVLADASRSRKLPAGSATRMEPTALLAAASISVR